MFVCTHSLTEERFGRRRCLSCGIPLREPRNAEAFAARKQGVQADDLPDTSAEASTGKPRETAS